MDRLPHILLSNAAAAMALALVAGAAARLLRRPPLTRALWVLVLLKLLTPPIWTIPVWTPQPAANPAPAPPVALTATGPDPIPYLQSDDTDPSDPIEFVAPSPQVSAHVHADPPLEVSRPAAPTPFPWRTATYATWLAGSAIYALVILAALIRVRRLVSRSIPAPRAVSAQAACLAQTFGLKRCPEISFIRDPLPPMLCAVFTAPRILLPVSLWQRLDDAQRQTVLAHELAHLRNRDHWVRALELLAGLLYWWHPAVWLSRRDLRESGEQCCDAWVVWAAPRLARSYAAAILEATEFISLAPNRLPALASGMGQFTDLRRRLIMIKQGTARRALSWPALTAVCSLGGVLLPLAPTFAQESPKPAAAVTDTAPAGVPVIVAVPAAPASPASPEKPSVSIIAAVPVAAESADAPRTEADPKPQPRPKAFYVKVDEASPDADRGQAEVDKARAEVDKLRAQLRAAEQRLNSIQRNRDAQKRTQIERDRQLERAKREADRAAQNANRNAEGPKPRFDMKNDTRFDFQQATPKNPAAGQQEYAQANARVRSKASQQDSDQAMQRRLDQMEKQLNEMVNQLRQMRRQGADPKPNGPGM